MLDVLLLKKLLDEQGRTRKWLARECGIELGSLNHILAGRRQPGLPVLKLMARALGVSEGSLYPTIALPITLVEAKAANG
jgi:transcriptional regulator with XRE-family HTH domain